MEELELYLEEVDEQMTKSLAHVGHELGKIRAGKANPAMLDGIMVQYYGTPTPINQVASITFPEARTIFIKPWEKGTIPEIERSIMNANIGLTPQSDGQQVIINIPILSEERRKQLVKQVHNECEQGRVSIRSIRKDANEQIKKIKGVSEDQLNNAEEEVQRLTNDYIAKVDGLMKKKEVEIMTI